MEKMERKQDGLWSAFWEWVFSTPISELASFGIDYDLRVVLFLKWMNGNGLQLEKIGHFFALMLFTKMQQNLRDNAA